MNKELKKEINVEEIKREITKDAFDKVYNLGKQKAQENFKKEIEELKLRNAELQVKIFNLEKENKELWKFKGSVLKLEGEINDSKKEIELWKKKKEKRNDTKRIL